MTEANRDARARGARRGGRTRSPGEQYELLAPAIDRVWHDEIGAIRRDLRLWVDEIARAGGEWMPLRFEWAFGYQDGGALAVGRDPTSRREPVTIDGRFQLHGSIDLVEERAATGELRVTDHKTGKYRGKDHMMVGGGAVLQPVLYSLALEQATRSSRRRRTAVLRDDRRRIPRRSHPADAAGATARRRGPRNHRPRHRNRLPGAGPGEKACTLVRLSRRCAGRPPSGASAGSRRRSRWPICSTCGGSRDRRLRSGQAPSCRITTIGSSSATDSTTRSSSRPPPAPARPPSSSRGF